MSGEHPCRPEATLGVAERRSGDLTEMWPVEIAVPVLGACIGSVVVALAAEGVEPEEQFLANQRRLQKRKAVNG